MDGVSLQFKCNSCEMKFENKQALVNHSKNFCLDSDYGNLQKLEARFNELGKVKATADRNLNIGDIKGYLKGDNASLLQKQKYGDLTLEEIRGYFQQDEAKFQDLQKKAIRRNETHMVDEIEKLKRERQIYRLNQNKEDGEMMELLKELEGKRDNQLRAKVEKETIQKELEQIDRSKLTVMQQEKKRELQKLAHERENIKLREDDLMNEIQKLQVTVKQKATRLEEENASLGGTVNRKGLHVIPQDKKKLIEDSIQKGQAIAHLQFERQQLKRERERIMNDLELVKKGDLKALKKTEASRWTATALIRNNEVDDFDRAQIDSQTKDDINNKQARINRLKGELQKTKESALGFDDGEFAIEQDNKFKYADAAEEYIGRVEERNKFDSKLLGQSLGAARERLEEERKGGRPVRIKTPLERSRELEYEPVRPPQPKNVLSQLPGFKNNNEPASKPTQPTKDSEDFPKKRKSKMKKKENGTEMGGYPMHPYMQGMGQMMPPPMQQPVMQPQYAYNPPPPQYYPPPPAYGQHSADPILHSSLAGLNKMIAKSEKKNIQLEKKLKGIKKQEQIEQENHTRKGFHQDQHIHPEIRMDFTQNEERCKDLEKEEKALMNLAAQEFDALKLLSNLNPDSDVYKFKMEQYKEMSRHRAEIEKLIQSQRLEKLRRDFEVQKRDGVFKFNEYEQNILAEETKKNMATGQMKDKYHRDNPEWEDERREYNEKEGFLVQWDYIKNLPKSTDNVQMVYAIHLNGAEVYPGRLVPMCLCRPQTDEDSRNMNMCIIDMTHTVQDIFPHTNARLIIEVQSVNPANQSIGIGWTILDLFDYLNHLKNGPFKLPLYQPPTFPGIRDNQIPFLTKLGKIMLFLRIAYPAYDYVSSLEVAPKNEHKYTIPSLLLPSSHLPNPQRQQAFQQVYQPQPQPRPNPMMPLPNIQKQPIPIIVQPPPQASNLPTPQNQIHMPTFDPTPIISPGQSRPHTEGLPYHHKGVNIHMHNLKNYQGITDFKIAVYIHDDNEKVFTQPDGNAAYFLSREFTAPPHQLRFATGTSIAPTAPGRGSKLIPGTGIPGTGIPGTGLRKSIRPPGSIPPPSGLSAGRKSIKSLKSQNLHPLKQESPEDEDDEDEEEKHPLTAKKRIKSPFANLIPLNYEDQFLGDLYAFRREKIESNPDKYPEPDLYNPSPEEFPKSYLIFQLLEKNPEEKPETASTISRLRGELNQEAGTDFNTTGFAIHELNNVRNGPTILFNDYEIPFYNMPVRIPLPPHYLPLTTTLSFTVNDYKNNFVKQVITPIPEVPEEVAFMKNEGPIDGARFKDGDGFDLYFDGLRLLPENAGPARLNIRSYARNMQRLTLPGNAFPDLDSKLGMQWFNFRWEFRLTEFNPTMVFVATVETYDKYTKDPKILGFICVNCFLDADTKRPAVDPANKDILLQEGSFQLPIFTQDPMRSPISMERVLLLDRVPGASCLVRIVKTRRDAAGNLPTTENVPQEEWIEKGLLEEPKEYEVGEYNTNFINIERDEMKMMERKLKKGSESVRDEVGKLAADNGINRKMNDEDMTEWLDNYLQVNPRTDFLNINYCTEYQEDMGYMVCIDGFYGCPTNLPYFCLLNQSPPAKFYSEERETKDVILVSEIDFESPQKSFQYLDGFCQFLTMGEERRVQMIAEVGSVVISKAAPKIVEIGWTLIPIFDNSKAPACFVRNGVFQIPIFKSPVPRGLIQELSQQEDCVQYLINLSKSLPQIKLIEGFSIIVRIRDVQFPSIYETPYDIRRFNTSHLPKTRLQKYMINRETEAKLKKGKKMNILIKKPDTVETFQKKITTAVVDHYHLDPSYLHSQAH